ncbi:MULTISPECIES: LysR family transcriptional regulator [Paraburkholderia]|uniref:LysR family transcriptional regulator n=1 Tax=Paraburkholderia podalyriae TaxID=1938811 RepID=A0ABR7PTI8_9BURK|nr:LysR family transcriptional regulator [Paraburkholderia podalyriae]MBC8749573.1 LysR family transcriptional regulator [Paraburkholderia podalyriae]
MNPTQLGARLTIHIETMLHHLTNGALEAFAATVPEGSSQGPVRFAAVVAASQLRAFIAIAACGSEATAAQTLGVSQSAVHQSLHAIENLLGIRLFYRLAAGTRLTIAGESLLRRVKLMMAELRSMEVKIAAWRGAVGGRVVVGVLPLSVPTFLPKAIELLKDRHAEVEIQIVDGTYESLVRQLANADIDVIAGALRPDGDVGDLKQIHLFQDDLVVVARRDHPCLDDHNLTLAKLLAWPWVRPLPGTPADHALQKVFEAEELELPDGTLQANSPFMTFAFVLQSDRLAFASRGDALSKGFSGQLCVLPLRLPATRRSIGLVTRGYGIPSLNLSGFLQACEDAAPQTDTDTTQQ